MISDRPKTELERVGYARPMTTDNSRPVFIVSTGRAGSMMMAKVLAMHQDLLVLHEPLPHLNVEAFSHWKGRHQVQRLRKRVKRKRSSLIAQSDWNRCTYVESSHYSAHLIRDLHNLFDARFIHLYRDGRSFVRSGLERGWWYPESYGDVFKRSPLGGFWEREILDRARRMLLLDVGFSWSDHRLDPPSRFGGRLEKISWLWAEINRSILNQLADFPDEMYTSLALEEFSEETLESVLDFVGVRTKSSVLHQMMRTARKRPNQTKKQTVPNFDSWSEEDKSTFREIAGPMMRQLGYTL